MLYYLRIGGSQTEDEVLLLAPKGKSSFGIKTLKGLAFRVRVSSSPRKMGPKRAGLSGVVPLVRLRSSGNHLREFTHALGNAD
ncbi:hypothetical protein M0802_012410 [Mischocyttarus mexicanus]|nr:hypothetical protein M0802_012410 [Mischocyttarus mexicanus]